MSIAQAAEPNSSSPKPIPNSTSTLAPSRVPLRASFQEGHGYNCSFRQTYPVPAGGPGFYRCGFSPCLTKPQLPHQQESGGRWWPVRPAARVGEWLWSFIHKHFCCPSGMSSWEERKGEVNRGIGAFTICSPPLQVHSHEASTVQQRTSYSKVSHQVRLGQDKSLGLLRSVWGPFQTLQTPA